MKTTLIIFVLLGIALFHDTDAWRRRRRRRRSDPDPTPSPPPNTPPRFNNCPQNLGNQYTTTATAVVTWVEPTCVDAESACTVTRSGPGSGSPFAEGSHSIAYTAYDSGGLSVGCAITFTVIVIHCSSPSTPQHCFVSCTLSNSVGSVCTYQCATGLTLSGSSQRVCQELSGNTAQWSGTQPTCTDNYPPTVTMCPSTITTDRTEYWGVEVSFTTPSATDNFDQILQISTNPTDLVSPYNFTVDTICEYYFQDDAGNTASCIFDVIINDLVVPEFLTCPSNQFLRTSQEMTPVTWDEPTYKEIPGDEVRLTCNYGSNSVLLPWGDNHVIYTATNTRSGLGEICDFVVMIEPMPCPRLRTPAHGAISCDNWAYGRYCSMSCNEQYDIPVPSPFQPATDVFSCGSSGQWTPTSYVPDCTQTRDPTKSNLPTDLLYYSGQCGSPSTLNDIAQSFIETINKSVHSDVCKLNEDCVVSNVFVTCGWPTRRRKRQALIGRRRKRSAEDASVENMLKDIGSIAFDGFKEGLSEGHLQEMWISMDLGTNITTPNGTREAQEKLQILARKVFDIFLTVGNEAPRISSIPEDADEEAYLLLGNHFIDCPQGYVPDRSNLRCVACTTGHYYDSASRTCPQCEYGYYQDEYAQTECKSCDVGQSTQQKGSPRRANCRDDCESGYFSTSGFAPCIQCPLDTFQPLIGQTACFECPDAKKTWNRGAMNVDQCIHLKW